MTDKELIARLRLYGSKFHHEFGHNDEAADRIEALIGERDPWSGVARREGVCMTCRGPNGAPEPYGCTDCLNTGYCGEHHNTVSDLEAKLAQAVEALESLIQQTHDCEKELTEDLHHVDFCGESEPLTKARATLAKIKGESHD